MKASKGGKLSIQQRIANFLLAYRPTTHCKTGRTPASLFLGRELRTRLTPLRPSVGEKVMDSQSKRKATHDAHSRFREFYPGDRILVKDLRKEHTWWPSSVAERSGPKSYVVVLNDGRVWKRHLDHIRRDTMDSTVAERDSERVPHDAASDPVPQATLSPSVPSPQQLPVNMAISNTVEPGTQVHLENANNSPPEVETPFLSGTSLSEASSIPSRRPGRVRFFEIRRTASMFFFTWQFWNWSVNLQFQQVYKHLLLSQ